jgi:hypothetical protein
MSAPNPTPGQPFTFGLINCGDGTNYCRGAFVVNDAGVVVGIGVRNECSRRSVDLKVTANGVTRRLCQERRSQRIFTAAEVVAAFGGTFHWDDDGVVFSLSRTT